MPLFSPRRRKQSPSGAAARERVEPLRSASPFNGEENMWPKRQTLPRRLRRALNKLWSRIVSRMRGMTRAETPPPLTATELHQLNWLRELEERHPRWMSAHPGQPDYFTHSPWSQSRSPSRVPTPVPRPGSLYPHYSIPESVSDYDRASINTDASRSRFEPEELFIPGPALTMAESESRQARVPLGDPMRDIRNMPPPSPPMPTPPPSPETVKLNRQRRHARAMASLRATTLLHSLERDETEVTYAEMFDPFDERTNARGMPPGDLHHPQPVHGADGNTRIKWLPEYMHIV